jgi:osmotically-inducible protein OsmY
MSGHNGKSDPSKASHAQHDATIHKRIDAHLENLRERHIQVEIHDGLVTITGAVRTYRQKERIHRLVMNLSGVRALKDLLRVQPAESVADGQIALHVRQALDANAELPTGTAVVHVVDGIVTLTGHVRTAEELFIAENVVSHCRGVKKVINELTVDPLDEITDEAACRAIRGALRYCEEFETEGITVSCADGKACLRGEVPTMMDRTLAEEVARMQAGVRSVENHISVRMQRIASVE